MKNIPRIKIAVVFFVAILITGTSVNAQQTKSDVFKLADEAMQNTKEMKANMKEINQMNISSVGHGENNPIAIMKLKKGVEETVVLIL